jgi:tRNA U38,U39,U40 pseudouridine synthase TruA
MTKNLPLVVMMLGLFSTSLLASKVDPSVISKITLETGNAKVALGDNPFKQIIEQNFVKAISDKIDHDKLIKVFNQLKGVVDWRSFRYSPIKIFNIRP